MKSGGRRISQETFDEVVQENVDDFDMTPEEALQDAIKQFLSQGVDLANVDTTGGVGRAEAEAALNRLRKVTNEDTDESFALTDANSRVAEVLAALQEVSTVCGSAQKEHRDRNLFIVIRMNGIVNLGHWLQTKAGREFSPSQRQQICTTAALTLSDICSLRDDVRDLFFHSFVLAERLESASQYFSKLVDSDDYVTSDEFISKLEETTALLILARTVGRTEAFKTDLVHNGAINWMPTLLKSLHDIGNAHPELYDMPSTSSEVATSEATAKANEAIVMEEVSSSDDVTTPPSEDTVSVSFKSRLTASIQRGCLFIRSLCIHDDLRSEMSSAYDNGKALLKQGTLLQTLVAFARQYTTQSDLAASALLSLRAMVTTNESVQLLALHGVTQMLTDIVRYGAYDVSSVGGGGSLNVLRASVSLVRNIAADDGKKDFFLGTGVLDGLFAIILRDDCSKDANIVEHFFGCLAQFTLRAPSTSVRVASNSTILEAMVQCMRRFANREGLQRQACLTIRNMAARCPELRGTLLDAGFEPVLRDAGRLSSVVDEAYSALRDLGCDVTYVKVNENGLVVPAYEQFGQRTTAFRPIYDDDDTVVAARVAENAQAPFARNDLSVLNEEEDEPASHANHEHSHAHSHEHNSCCTTDDGNIPHDHSHDHSSDVTHHHNHAHECC